MIARAQVPRNSKSSSSSDYSDCSDRSISTAPTDHSARPSMRQYQSSGNPYCKDEWDGSRGMCDEDIRHQGLAETSTSSVSSIDDADQNQSLSLYSAPYDGNEAVAPKALASSPHQFAEHFPSTQRLCIRHDDSTMDGNMNLRIDTKTRTYHGQDLDLTLFHLRMHDLKRREFSLRRYCRDSGREICHSRRKYSKPSVIRRPSLQRSMSSALQSLRPKSDTKFNPTSNLKRHDSGYDSMPEDDVEDVTRKPSTKETGNACIPTSTTLIEFSNYAHVEVKCRGPKTSKRYEFEYWGAKYVWKRVIVTSGNFKEISYHLYNIKTSESLAHIVPVPQSSFDLREESAKGGWVSPCAMMLEESVVERSADFADVIVASGLISLVDDCIKGKWHEQSQVQIMRSPLKMNHEHVGARRFLGEVFHRRDKRPVQSHPCVRPSTS